MTVAEMYFIMMFTLHSVDEVWNCYNPRKFPSKKYMVCQWTEEDISNSSTGVTVVASERIRINGIGTNMGLIITNSSIYDKPITLQGAIVDFSPRGIRR